MKDKAIRIVMTSDKIELLTEYSEYLERKGYLDSDWRDEQPGAIAGFIEESKKIKMQSGVKVQDLPNRVNLTI